MSDILCLRCGSTAISCRYRETYEGYPWAGDDGRLHAEWVRVEKREFLGPTPGTIRLWCRDCSHVWILTEEETVRGPDPVTDYQI